MKELILVKSNVRKNKSATIGLILLIMLAACFLNIVILLLSDYNTYPNHLAAKLNSEDAYIQIEDENALIDRNIIDKYIGNDVNEYEIQRLTSNIEEIPYGDGKVSLLLNINTIDKALERKICKPEIVSEDKSIISNYIYLPYIFSTGGGYKIGDEYKPILFGNEYNFKIKGFINNVTFASVNTGTIEIFVDSSTYNKIKNTQKETTLVLFDLKDGVDNSLFINHLSKNINGNYSLATNVGTIENSISGRTFISIILAIIFVLISLIVVVVVLLMLSNNISNHIKENMKTIGAIKALGYTNQNIKMSFMLQFLIISFIGSIVGILLSYLLYSPITNIISNQSGFPYKLSFHFWPIVVVLACVMGIVDLSVLIFTKKINNITPIVALREGIQTHNFKKNSVSLSKTKLPLNISLALKTMFYNMKQNIMTFIVIIFLVYLGVIGMVLYQNFGINPKISLVTFEICDGAIGSNDSTHNEDVYNWLKNNDKIQNLRLVTNVVVDMEDAKLYTYILDNAENLKNKDVCYEGRLPKADNEFAISGKIAKSYGYKIGDLVELTYGNNKASYIITGYIQTTNNNGSESVLLDNGAKKILGDYGKMYFFETSCNPQNVIDDAQSKFGSDITCHNFKDLIKGTLPVFKTVALAVVVVILIISFLVILLVLYLLIKTLINNKKKDYGILKSIGYTSRNIILQNAISFMPTIITSVIISTTISIFLANPTIGFVMKMFGIMKLSFDIPILLIILMAVGFVVVSFGIAILLSHKIKKIEPYKLLIEN